MTTEWKLKTGENSVRYTVSVPNFRKKINSFKNGRLIWSKHFKVGRTFFALSIEPSNPSHVGVYLHNMSDWDVFADMKFEVNGFIADLGKERFGRKGSNTDHWGREDIVPHHRCSNQDLLSNGSFELEAYIELDDEEVLPQQDGEEEVISKTKSHVDKKFEEMEKKIRTHFDKKFEEMEKKIEDLKTSGRRSSSSDLDLECPVCAETVRRPMRLQQCGQVGSKYCFQFL